MGQLVNGLPFMIAFPGCRVNGPAAVVYDSERGRRKAVWENRWKANERGDGDPRGFAAAAYILPFIAGSPEGTRSRPRRRRTFSSTSITNENTSGVRNSVTIVEKARPPTITDPMPR